MPAHSSFGKTIAGTEEENGESCKSWIAWVGDESKRLDMLPECPGRRLEITLALGRSLARSECDPSYKSYSAMPSHRSGETLADPKCKRAPYVEDHPGACVRNMLLAAGAFGKPQAPPRSRQSVEAALVQGMRRHHDHAAPSNWQPRVLSAATS